MSERRTRAEKNEPRRNLLLGILVALVAAVATVVSITAINGLPFSNPYRVDAIVPASGPIVRPGDEVRVGGRRVGEVREVEPAPDGRMIEMDLTEGEVGPDATATVRLRGLAGAVFIELDPGDTAEAAPSGSTIPRARTASGVQLTDVISTFDGRTRAALRHAATGYGAGIAGRGPELNSMLADLPPTLESGERLARALVSEPGRLAALVGDAGTVAGALGADRGALAGLITGARETLEATAAEASSLGAAIDATPGAEQALADLTPEAVPLLDDLNSASRALTPAALELERALPSVNSLLARESELDSLASLAAAAVPVLDAAGPVIDGIEPAGLTLSPLIEAGEPLAVYASRYPEEIIGGPYGFTTWGKFAYDEGQAQGARAVRFAPVLTCAPGRDPYPAPGEASNDRLACND
jgi:virulence factor Mce-like protein